MINITNNTIGAQPGSVGVVQAPMSCDDGNPCTIDYPGPMGCVNEPMSCDDGNPLTIDYCKAGSCLHDLVSCDDGNPCTNDYPGPMGCVNEPISCDDSNPCTVDSCGPTGCSHNLVDCDDVSQEFRSYCGCPDMSADDEKTPMPLERQNEDVFSIRLDLEDNADGNASQEENERSGIINNLAEIKSPAEEGVIAGIANDTSYANDTRYVNDTSYANDTQKSSGEYDNNTFSNATENVSKFSETRQDTEKSYAKEPSSCDDGDPCTIDQIVDGKCKHFMMVCDDKNISTYDYCYQGNCTHTIMNCNDGDICTVDSFDGTKCVHMPKSCDDHDPCTNDFCDKVSGCHNVVINTDGDACTIDCENGIDVRKPLICDDGNPFTRDYCDKVRGCVYKPLFWGPIYYKNYPYGTYYPYGSYYPSSYHLPSIYSPGWGPNWAYYPYNYYQPYTAPAGVSSPAGTVSPTGSVSTTGTTSPTSTAPPTESYTIPADKVITLPWNDTVIALDELQVKNGVAFSSASPLRFTIPMGDIPSSQSISERAEMVGLSWADSGKPFTLTLIRPNGSILSEEKEDENVLHLTEGNYDYYFLRSPAKGSWTAMVTPTETPASGQGFSLISGPVRGVVSPIEE